MTNRSTDVALESFFDRDQWGLSIGSFRFAPRADIPAAPVFMSTRPNKPTPLNMESRGFSKSPNFFPAGY
jgi:hypothetical protein